MAILLTIQAESWLDSPQPPRDLNVAPVLHSDSECSPSGSNNCVIFDESTGKNVWYYNLDTIPSATKVRIYGKRQNSTNTPAVKLTYFTGAVSQDDVINTTISTDGIQYVETSTMPFSDNKVLVVRGGDGFIMDRIEFLDDTVTPPTGTKNIQQISGSTITKSGGTMKFKNAGTLSIPSGAKIKFTPSFSPTFTGTITPTCTKGTFAASGTDFELTLSADIAAAETFDVTVSFSSFLKNAKTFTFDAISVTGYTEESLTDDTASATFKPASDMQITEKSKSANGFTFTVKNLGDSIGSGEKMLLKISGTNLGTMTATSSKGSFSGSDFTNGIDFTLSSDFDTNAEFDISIAFSTAVSGNYSAKNTLTFDSSKVTDSPLTNNTIDISFTSTARNTSMSVTLIGTSYYIGQVQTGTANQPGKIQVIKDNNVFAEVNTTGVNNNFSYTTTALGTFYFRLVNANGTSPDSNPINIISSSANNNSGNQSTTITTNDSSSKNGFQFTTPVILAILALLIFLWWIIVFFIIKNDKDK